MLKLQFKDRRRESVWLVDEHFTIGKSASNSLMLKDASIEDNHAEIINKSDLLSLIKKAPNASIKVNGKEIEQSAILKANDIITLGTIELEIIDSQSLTSNHSKTIKPTPIWSLHSNASWLEKNDFTINEKTIIGRDPSCDICLSLDYLSRKHVSLELQNGRLFIEDLNSSNGTFVNGNKIQKTELKPGDKIKLDVLTFIVRGPDAEISNDPHKTIIRTISTATTSTATTPTPKKAASTTSNTKNKSEQKNLASQKVRKRLASEGKQAWISGENQFKTKPEKKGKSHLAITVIALLIIASGLTYVLVA